MEGKPSDIALLVAESKFVVSREALMENSSYFRAMLDGRFRESAMKIIELFGIDDKAFAVILDYITKKEIDLVALSHGVYAVLESADMLGEDTLKQDIRKELEENWWKLKTLDEVLDLGQWLDIRPQIFCRVLKYIKSKFVKRNEEKEESVTYLSEFVTVIMKCLISSNPNSDRGEIDFAKEILSWSMECHIVESDLRTLFGFLLMDVKELDLLDIVSQIDFTCSMKQLELAFKDKREKFQKHIHEICAVNLDERFDEHPVALNIHDWKWDDVVDVNVDDFVNITKITESELEANAEDLVCISVWCGFAIFIVSPCREEVSGKFEFRSILPKLRILEFGDDCDFNFYNNSLQFKDVFLVEDTCHGCENCPNFVSDLFVIKLEFENGRRKLKEISHTNCKTATVTGCQLVKIEDTLHVFLSYRGKDNDGSAVYHFDIKLTGLDKIIEIPDLNLEPPLLVTDSLLVPVAVAALKGEPLILFIEDDEYLWLTSYNSQLSCLEPLGYLPPFPDGKEFYNNDFFHLVTRA